MGEVKIQNKRYDYVKSVGVSATCENEKKNTITLRLVYYDTSVEDIYLDVESLEDSVLFTNTDNCVVLAELVGVGRGAVLEGRVGVVHQGLNQKDLLEVLGRLDRCKYSVPDCIIAKADVKKMEKALKEATKQIKRKCKKVIRLSGEFKTLLLNYGEVYLKDCVFRTVDMIDTLSIIGSVETANIKGCIYLGEKN